MPRIVHAIERCGGLEFRAFEIPLPSFNEPGSHRQGTSLYCFRSRELKRAFPQKHATKTTEKNPALYYSIADEEDLHFRYTHLREFYERKFPDAVWRDPGPDFLPVGIHAIPLIKVASVFEFYEAIGYDYKKQKWLPQSEVQKFKTDFYRANAIMMGQQARTANQIAPPEILENNQTATESGCEPRSSDSGTAEGARP